MLLQIGYCLNPQFFCNRSTDCQPLSVIGLRVVKPGKLKLLLILLLYSVIHFLRICDHIHAKY